MASKVLIKIPAVNFNQVGKHGADLVNSPPMCSAAIPAPAPSPSNIHSSLDPLLQVHQLEQNIRFLKEQHQLMLSALHQEIEVLRSRNRDLQFQLVFTRGDAKSATPPVDEASKSKVPVVLSQPHQSPVTSPRAEHLEREVADLRISLGEARTKNAKLQEIIDEQQRKLAELSIKAERKQPTEREIALANQLQETVQLVHRMRRFNEEQRRELAVLKGQKFGAPQAPEVIGEPVRAVKHHQLGQPPRPQPPQPPQPQILQQQQQQQPRVAAPTRPQHHHHHQAHHKLQQQQQHPPQRHEQHFFPREIQSEGGPPNQRFPPLPNAQTYWQNNGHSRWTAGMERSGQRPGPGPGPRPSMSLARPAESMPSLPAISPGSGGPNGRRTHYFRNGGAHQDNSDANRRFWGKGSGGGGGGGRNHRNHDE